MQTQQPMVYKSISACENASVCLHMLCKYTHVHAIAMCMHAWMVLIYAMWGGWKAVSGQGSLSLLPAWS